MSKIMDGKLVAQKIKDRVAKWIVTDLDRKPQLLIITIGEDDASKVYVRNKMRAADEVGIEASHWIYTEDDYWSGRVADDFNSGFPDFDAVILQLPVPSYVDAGELIEKIPFWKDVDGLTMAQKGRFEAIPKRCHILDALIPCTPQGVVELIDEYVPFEDLKGKNALVIGRSELVGKPVAKLLLEADMTVTVAHSRTPRHELLQAFANADLVVSAAGAPNLITEEDALQFLKDNHHYINGSFDFKYKRIIVDVSINRDENGKLCGDFSEEFKQKYSEYYTPVPGGVGPMTVAMLMFNTYMAAKHGWFWEGKEKKKELTE
jgi:methylenetetrahydrofolate dehydrogenase (NADP+)/methenyltetrahydrofolate cyclohydrolase